MKKIVTQSITILTLIACTLTTNTTRAALEDELHRLVEQQEHDELAIFLSTHSVLNLEVCDEQNQTPLIKAVLAHDLYSVTLLILAGSCTLPALKTSSLAPELEENDQPGKLQAAVCAAFLTTIVTPEPSLWKLCGLSYGQDVLAIRLLLLLDNPTQEESMPEAEKLVTLLAKTREEQKENLNIIASQAADELAILTKSVSSQAPALFSVVASLGEECLQKTTNYDQNKTIPSKQDIESISPEICTNILKIINRYSEKHATALSVTLENQYNKLLDALRKFVEQNQASTITP